MKCPIDNVELQMTERQSVEIDYCPTCRGVWLDRGELDKIIERVAQDVPSNPSPSAQERTYPNLQQYGAYHDKHGYKKRKGLLGELFDF